MNSSKAQKSDLPRDSECERPCEILIVGRAKGLVL